MKLICLILLHFILASVANGSHFLGGTITWHPLNASDTGTPVAIVITQTYSWTYARMPCTNAMIAGNQYVPNYGGLASIQLGCINNCGAGSVGYSPINVISICTDFSASVGITVGQRLDIVYLASGDDFSVAFQDTAWRPLATNPSASWSISTYINLEPRSDNGLYNNAPVATMMSPINIPVNQSTVINVPVGDADGDPLRCRWSTQSNGVDECGDVCPPSSLPPSTVIDPNCTIIITGQNVGDWFAVALMVEDFIDSTSTIPLSSVPVQFLVQVVGPASCGIPPEIIGIPPEQSCTSVIVGETFTTELIAVNNCGPNVTIDDIATLSFSGMIESDITELNSTIYYKNITWTPTSAQLGYQVMCAMAFDSQNAQSSQYCFKFYVSEDGVCSCPGDPCITTTSTITTTTATSTTSTSTTSTTATTSTTSMTSASSTSITSTTSTSTTSTTMTTATTTTETTTTMTTMTTTTATTITTITTTTTTTTTATTTLEKSDPVNWPLIGSIIGLLLLAALTLCGFVCWCYLCLLDGDKYTHEREGIIELYHIERYTNPKCPWIDSENKNIDMHTNFEMSTVNKEKMKLFRTKSAKMKNISIINDTPISNAGIRVRRQPKNIKNVVQITHLRSKPPMITDQSSINDPDPLIIGNTIYLDNFNEVNQILDTLNLDKMNYLLSTHPPIPMEKIELSPSLSSESIKLNSTIDDSKIFSSPIHTESAQSAKKKLKSYKKLKSNKIAVLKPIIKEKDKNNNRYYSIRIGRILRQNSAKSLTNI